MHLGEGSYTVPESTVSQELDLQEAFKEHPKLIPVADLGLGPLLVVGRETTVSSGGSVDVLAVDMRGQLVVAEFKRGPENPDSRRVMAQVLEYASCLWGMSYEDFDDSVVRPYLISDRCAGGASQGATNLEQAATCVWQGDEGFSAEGFRQALTDCLAEGRIHCIIISSEIDPNTARVIQFLNATAAFRCYGIEVDHFSDGERRVFVPRATVLPSAGQISPPASITTTRANFLAACSERARHFFAALLDSVQAMGAGVSWATRGFSLYVDLGSSNPRVLYGFPRGTVGHAMDYVQLYTSELRSRGVPEAPLQDYLAAASGLTIYSRTQSGNITVDIDEKVDDVSTQMVIAAVQRVIAAARATIPPADGSA